MNLSAFVELGGVAAVLEALRAVTKGLQQALRQQQQPRELQAAATQPQPPLPWHDALTASLPALLQVRLQRVRDPSAAVLLLGSNDT